MKKILYIFVFIITSALSLGNMGSREESMEMMRHHHGKHYMKEFHGERELTQEQREDLMILRRDMMEKERAINSRLRRIRGEMNHCMRRDESKELQRYYELLSMERKRLMREKRSIRDSFKAEIDEIIKKQ